MVAGALDEGQNAMWCQINGTLESAAEDGGHDLARGWPLPDPDARQDVQWSPAEASAVISWHRGTAALESAKKQLLATVGKATPKVKSEVPSDDDDNLQKQIRAAVNKAQEAKDSGAN